MLQEIPATTANKNMCTRYAVLNLIAEAIVLYSIKPLTGFAIAFPDVVDVCEGRLSLIKLFTSRIAPELGCDWLVISETLCEKALPSKKSRE